MTDHREPDHFDEAFSAWARRAPSTPADVAARRMAARLADASQAAAGAGAWARRIAVTCGVVLVVASGVLLWRSEAPPPRPSPAVEVLPVLPDNVVIFWLDPETPVYFVVSAAGDVPGGIP
jgi:hypothetical protein